MTATMGETTITQKPRKPKQYANEFEKRLMVDNLRAAVEIYGKDHLREGFKSRKGQNVFRHHSSPATRQRNLSRY